MDNQEEKYMAGLNTDTLEVNLPTEIADILHYEHPVELSDVDGLMVEWEFESGHRHWETFDTIEELEAAVAKQQAERKEGERKWKEEMMGRTLTVVEY